MRCTGVHQLYSLKSVMNYVDMTDILEHYQSYFPAENCEVVIPQEVQYTTRSSLLYSGWRRLPLSGMSQGSSSHMVHLGVDEGHT